MIHVDLDVSRITFQDVVHKYVDAKAGSLIGTYRTKNWTFAGVVGEKTIYIAPAGVPSHTASGMIASGAFSYTASRFLSLTCALGRDVGSSVAAQNATDYQTFVRFDATFHLF